MNKTVDYAVNPVKTAYDGKAAEDASMTANIAYALNAEKGTTRLFQTAVNLDSIETAWDEMKEAKERWGKTDGIRELKIEVFAAMHDLNLAAAYCDRLYVMRGGRMFAAGTPQEVLTPEMLAEVFRVRAELQTLPSGRLNIIYHGGI